MSTPQPPSVPGNFDASSYASGLTAPPPDLLTSPAESTLDDRPRRRTPLVLVAVATVVALVLGGVAYAGMRLWYGSGTQPEEATPATVVAFARLDLSPGYGQRMKINNLVKKFPQESGEDAVDQLKREIFKAYDIDEASYRSHVEPWFAARVGLAVWLDDAQQPYSLIVLAVDDESAARTGLAELQRKDGADRFGFVVRNGYALVAKGSEQAQAAVEAAGKDAERESLAASARFREGADWLPAEQTALAWADLEGFGAATKAMMEAALAAMPEGLDEDEMASTSRMGAFLSPGMGGAEPWSDLKGRVIVGARATDNGVEVRFRGFGTGALAPPATGDARSIVDSLSANSAVAGSFLVGDLGTPFGGGVADADEMLPEELLKDLPPSEAEQVLNQMREGRQRLEALNKAFSAVTGATISVAVTNLSETLPGLVASAETVSADKAATLAEALKLLSPDVTVTASGSKVELKTKGYAAEGGTLAGQALYREAMDGAPDNATAVLYMDIQRLLADTKMTDRERAQAKPLKAIGLSTGTEGGDVVGLLRVVIK